MIQRKITEEKGRSFIGKTFVVFVEKRNVENPKEQIGRMDQDRRVIFEADQDYAGQFVRMEFTGLHHETFRARVVQAETFFPGGSRN